MSIIFNSSIAFKSNRFAKNDTSIANEVYELNETGNEQVGGGAKVVEGYNQDRQEKERVRVSEPVRERVLTWNLGGARAWCSSYLPD